MHDNRGRPDWSRQRKQLIITSMSYSWSKTSLEGLQLQHNQLIEGKYFRLLPCSLTRPQPRYRYRHRHHPLPTTIKTRRIFDFPFPAHYLEWSHF